MNADQNVKSAKTKPSAVRDYPSGCGRCADAQYSELGTQKSKAATTPEPSVPSGTASQDSHFRNGKRNRKGSGKASINPDAKKFRRSSGVASGSGSARKAFTQTLRLYDAIRRTLLLEEELKMKDAGKGSRPDLNAGGIINSKGLSVNRSGKVIGAVPGVDVGDQFYFRMEITCVGMHGPIQGGIEYLTTKESEWNTPVATSIISSGGYDDRDDGDELIYTGQGGKSGVDSKPNEDQKLERGNLAMEESMKHEVPIRVIRGTKDPASPTGRTYTYDGLYTVKASWSEKGKFGFEVFKFKLHRLPGQPDRGSALIKLSNHLKYKPGTRKGLRVPDLSQGKEGLPVCVVNSVDAELSPAAFEYSTSVQYSSGVSQQFGDPEGCDCIGVCSASQSCSCFSRNRNAFAYLNSGHLVKERGLIYECGSNCKCSLSCRNRLTQRGPKHRLEVFKTEDRGWGLRSWDSIPAGAFVCEYTGRIVNNLHSLHGTDYVLNLSSLPKNPPWGDVSMILESQVSLAACDVARPEVIMDSSEIGNAARFINHSCSPNVLVQCVLQDHQDIRCLHLMLFAMDNIPPFRELTIDYCSGTPTPEQSKVCLCRSADCRGKYY